MLLMLDTILRTTSLMTLLIRGRLMQFAKWNNIFRKK